MSKRYIDTVDQLLALPIGTKITGLFWDVQDQANTLSTVTIEQPCKALSMGDWLLVYLNGKVWFSNLEQRLSLDNLCYIEDEVTTCTL
jgi:hypothetical protein